MVLIKSKYLFLYQDRVVTNLDNLEYSGISLNMENSGNSVQPQGKTVTNKQSIFSSSFKYLVRVR